MPPTSAGLDWDVVVRSQAIADLLVHDRYDQPTAEPAKSVQGPASRAAFKLGPHSGTAFPPPGDETRETDMHVYKVVVGVALARPPKVDEYRLVLVASNSRYEAELIACQIAACTSVMPVSSQVIDPEFVDMLDDFMNDNGELLARV